MQHLKTLSNTPLIDDKTLHFFAHYMLFNTTVLLLGTYGFKYFFSFDLPNAIFEVWLPLQVILTALSYWAIKKRWSLYPSQLLAIILVSETILVTYLYLSGGSINPLIHILIAPIALSLFVLPKQHTFIIIVVTSIAYLLLNQYYVPIMSFKLPNLKAFFEWHLTGSALAFLITSALLMMIILPLKSLVESHRNKLFELQKDVQQKEYLISLASFAASSAHKLSTPLNTLTLLESDFKSRLDQKEFGEDLELFSSQLKVCQQAIQDIRLKADQANNPSKFFETDLKTFLEELKEEFMLINPMSSLKINNQSQHQTVAISPNFSMALLNLIDNSSRYSSSPILLKILDADDSLMFQIRDQGPGIDETLLPKLGKQPLNGTEGSGLGIYLSQTIIEKHQGQLQFSNLVQGTLATVTIPLHGHETL